MIKISDITNLTENEEIKIIDFLIEKIKQNLPERKFMFFHKNTPTIKLIREGSGRTRFNTYEYQFDQYKTIIPIPTDYLVQAIEHNIIQIIKMIATDIASKIKNIYKDTVYYRSVEIKVNDFTKEKKIEFCIHLAGEKYKPVSETKIILTTKELQLEIPLKKETQKNEINTELIADMIVKKWVPWGCWQK